MIVDNNEEITTGNDGTEMCSSGADVAVEMCSPESHDTRGDGCLDVKNREIKVRKWRISGLVRHSTFRGHSGNDCGIEITI